MQNLGQVTLSQVEQAIQNLGGQATWDKILDQVTKLRNGDYSYYLDWLNYKTTTFQVIQRHCLGYRKYKGPSRFEKVGRNTFRLIVSPSKLTQNIRTLTEVKHTPIAISESSTSAEEQASDHSEYSESRQTSRERYFFARNPQLVRDAKRKLGYICQVCKFNFEHKYGDLGREYIEVHHLDPLSERPKAEWREELKTRLDRVAVVCSNCHRIIHRKRPAVSIEHLMQCVKERLTQQSDAADGK